MPTGDNPARGEKHGRAKITDEQAEAVRQDTGTEYGVAKRYGISRRQVGRIRRREQRGA